ncbi:MAG: hypothetical protein J6Y85_02860 [Alphaproteobacteria bacterium]|nr:hypothetical protein [Alphaproteobacteria bacterium]
MDQQKLLEAFNQTPAGRVILGKEALRNRLGRVIHGLVYKHPKSMITLGSLAFAGSLVTGLGVMMLTTPIMFAGAYAALSPKKLEKAGCEFLANVAVRKADAFAHFLKKQNLTASEQEQAVLQYLCQNLPVGMKQEYLETHPNAAGQIISGKPDEACYHNFDVYHLEALQEQFTKGKDKGGVLHGMFQTFTPKYQKQKKIAAIIAAKRWQRRQQWERMPSPKLSWMKFKRETETQKKYPHDTISAVLRKNTTHVVVHNPNITTSAQHDLPSLPVAEGR